MHQKVSDYITFPIIGFLVGFVVYSPAIIWLVFYGLILATVRQSSLSGRVKVVIQGLLWFVFLIAASTVLFLNTQNQLYVTPYTPYNNEITPTLNINQRTHELRFVRFSYPRDYELWLVSENDVRLLSPEKIYFGIDAMSEKMYSIRETETIATNFTTFAQQYANQLQATAEEFGLQHVPTIIEKDGGVEWVLPPYVSGPHYHLRTDVYNGMPALIEQSNFGAMCGNVYNVQIWIGGGRIVTFSIDCYGTYPEREDITFITEIISSFERL